MPKTHQVWNPAILEKSPLFDVFAPLTRRFCSSPEWPLLEQYTDLVEQQRALRTPHLSRVEFVRAAPRAARFRRKSPIDITELYDGRIALKREVPCYAQSYHDLFNAIAWAAFPRAKRMLHERQYHTLRRWLPEGALRIPNRRTREQDALTVFDEGGSALITTPAAFRRLSATPELTLEAAAQADSTVVLFGHALMEHVAYGKETIRSAALVILTDESPPQGEALLELVDQRVSAALTDPNAFNKPGMDTAIRVTAPCNVRQES